MRVGLLVLLMLASSAFGQGRWFPKISDVNSTTTALAGSDTFTGEWELCYGYNTVSVALATDQDGTLTIQFSTSKTDPNIDSQLSYKVLAGSVEVPHRLITYRAFCRVKFVNTSASAQTYLRLQTLYKLHSGLPSAPLNGNIGQDHDAILARVFPADLEIPVGRYPGISIVNKFGRNPDIDTGTVPEDVWAGGGVYTGFPTGTPELIEVLSSSSNDTDGGSGCEVVTVYGLDANGVEQSENVTLSGTTPVDTASTYSRLFRVQCIESNNGSNDTFNDGSITARWTTTTSVVFAVMPADRGQTQIATYTIPSGKTGLLRNFKASVNDATSTVVDGGLWVRPDGASPRLIRIFSASQTDSHSEQIFGGIVLTELTDISVRITGTSSSNAAITSNFDILLIDNI